MSMSPEDTVPSDVAVPETDSNLKQAVRSGEKAEAEGREPTQTQKVAMEEDHLPNNGLSPEYAEDQTEDQTGIAPDRTRS